MEGGEELSSYSRGGAPGTGNEANRNALGDESRKMDKEHSKIKKDGRRGSVKREKRNKQNKCFGGGGGRADGQGPAAVPRGRRATVSAGLELAQFRPGLLTAARNQTRTTHSRWVHTHGQSRLETNKQRELDKHTQREQSVYSARAHTHTHTE